MTEEKKLLYRKAYVELYEIIKNLPKEEQDKIPENFINNLCANMDKNYSFEMDKEKELFEQEYKTETKALFVELYEKYLAPENEKCFWKDYDKICLNMIRSKKTENKN